MTRRFCADGHEVPEGMSLCACGEDVDESYQQRADPAEQALEQDGQVSADTPLTCWQCGEPTPDTKPTICLACGKPLTPPGLMLTFPAGKLVLSRGEQVQLGRCPELPHAYLCAAFDNVSRLHATVGVDDANGTWIRDDISTNGTFINGREIKPSKVPHSLHDGDSIRLGKDLTATVRIYQNGKGQ